MSNALASTIDELSPRQRQTFDALLDAAEDEIRSVGFNGLTVRNVAARAEVAPATAYNYFGSKEHLVGEVFWRRLSHLPPTKLDRRHTPAKRITAVLGEISMLIADEPELSAACTTALLADDQLVKSLRERIGAEVHGRLVDALGVDDPVVVGALELAYSGALLLSGTGHLSYDLLGERLADAAELIVGTD
ncbi:MAG: TetR/AcrR family transcriptional regulator [Microthrixaceae bacterium]|nr:TetR/AcrR family transcriptional regulator [Microthrixaceae bacterium]